MSDLAGLYQELILDHAKRPHGYGLVEHPSAESHQLNPTCGDEITLQLNVADDGTLTSVTWEGHGCAISQSSASLLAQLFAGLPVSQLQPRIDSFRTMMRSRGTVEPDEELLGDAAVLSGASKFIARVKCAMLGWVAAEDALTRLR
ncbi:MULTISPECIES: Fe-S cluster assembly sulfur transfer protein SufU [unclassified Leifsonia]|uniref:Fe-S cluster assembly sulfur transfer protein SufU n=1 Tax=unclassified Leifsonia TaxID=2663824 RepID=UPI0006F787CB|nr:MULTISPECIES: SUF system NifU family Fe-S cluster assembly protein [unclassified Leifsonia]KQX07609.1 nitrogen fixation protein NifU [Leifsonia sp. Root1293]KRA11891.1 nitrogen fixation protein NifU [Leifsonia sp. Root60]